MRTTLSISGIGDATLLLNEYLLRKANCLWKYNPVAGCGMDLLSVNMIQSTKTEESLPNMQPGTYSWDFIINRSYIVSRNQIGLSIDAN